MPGTTPNNAFRYPLATEAPDGPGAILALATDVDSLVVGAGTWTPALGGTGATWGSGGFGGGSWTRIGKHITAKGRIVFGAVASFGTGTPAIGGLPATIVANYSNGYGLFFPPSGATPVVFMFHGIDGANMDIRVIRSQAAASMADAPLAWSYGTPGQTAELHFTLDLTTT